MALSAPAGQVDSLRELLPGALISGAADVGVSGCTCDSRRVKPGDLFVAIEGGRRDGHFFIEEAVARGCAAVVSQRLLSGLSVPAIQVGNARAAFGLICQALAGRPSETLKLIGVTGTNGKTTTACLIAGILNHSGRKAGLLGTLGYFDGEDVVSEEHPEGDSPIFAAQKFGQSPWHTTPPADVLAKQLAGMVENGCTHAVMEVSSHALAQSRVAGVQFDAACVTNVTRDHLDFHPTLHDYRVAKSRLFDHLRGEGFAVVNADDPVAAGYLQRFDGPALTIGIHSPAEITGVPLEQSIDRQTFLITAGGETAAVETVMIGKHHVYNCLTAAAVGLAYGLDLADVVRSLEAAEHVPGRLERIESGQPFGVFVDYAHTPDALEISLQTLRAVTRGRLICVFGAGGDRDRAKRPEMGRTVGCLADEAVVTSDNPRNENPEKIIKEILSGFADRRRAKVIAARKKAIYHALRSARPGDCVLIAGKGHEGFQIVGNRRIPHDDRAVARRWLFKERT
ncbi:MAG: UDP-N-acetylmuramoyl-L-alanyl-D-glutamate--2,6-diaminopimelate ligase [Pirellulales bacterium]|nr:UDP-N-acetylmuramoyl-L-alanyl-D-glutamate--2,6-diaminopimelate ligase [Pirellulales bacterium]